MSAFVFFSNVSRLRRGGSHCAPWTESFCILNPHWYWTFYTKNHSKNKINCILDAKKINKKVHCECDLNPSSVCPVGQDAADLGSVFIGSENHGYSVSESCSRSTRSGRWHCGIALETPGRQFVFMCEQEEERREWMEAFRAVISQPMTPEDYASTMSPSALKQWTPCLHVEIWIWYLSLFLRRWSCFETRKMTGIFLTELSTVTS